MDKDDKEEEGLSQNYVLDYFISVCITIIGRLGLETNKNKELKQCKCVCPDIVKKLLELTKELEGLFPKLKKSVIAPNERKDLYNSINNIHLKFNEVILHLIKK